MDDLARPRLHGPIRNLRTETAEWNAGAADWKPSSHFTVTTFHLDGKTETADFHNPDGSVHHTRYLYDQASRLAEIDTSRNDEPIQKTLYIYDESGRHIKTTHPQADGSFIDSQTCSYDAEGRMTRIVNLPEPTPYRDQEGRLVAQCIGYNIEGTDLHLSADGSGRMTTLYDKQNLPAKVIFQSERRSPMKEIRFERDAEGRPLIIDVVVGESPFRDMVDQHPPEQRVAMAHVLSQIFGSSFSRMTYTYDDRGRLLEKTHTMGKLSEERTAFRYDGLHDEAVEEIVEGHSRTASIEESGAIQYNEEKISTQHNRFTYNYDEHGNWTERIVLYQHEKDTAFQPSNRERRLLTYAE